MKLPHCSLIVTPIFVFCPLAYNATSLSASPLYPFPRHHSHHNHHNHHCSRRSMAQRYYLDLASCVKWMDLHYSRSKSNVD